MTSAWSVAADILADYRPTRTAWTPQPHQIPPPGSWRWWMLLAGRGAGKTDACAAYVNAHVSGPPCIPSIPGGHRVAIVAPTLGDASHACVNGPSGLKVHNPAVRELTRKGGTFVVWPNGAEAKLLGAHTPEDVERLRAAGNNCLAWFEEFAAWRQLEECFKHADLGLRLGPKPRAIMSTTPKPRPLVKTLAHLAGDYAYDAHDATEYARQLLTRTRPDEVALTRAHTHDNPHLAAEQRDRYDTTYGDTRLGKQELAGEILEDVEGALWTHTMIETDRVVEHPPLRRVVVAIDPASGEKSAEFAIIVAGVGWDGHAYVIADHTVRGSADVKAAAILQAWTTHEPVSRVLVEDAFGQLGYVKLLLKSSAPQIPLTPATSKTGGYALPRGEGGVAKERRAEPVVTLYEQHKVHHVGELPLLEAQMNSWVPGEGESPDRIDALVYAVTELLLGAGGPVRSFSPAARSLGVRRAR